MQRILKEYLALISVLLLHEGGELANSVSAFCPGYSSSQIAFVLPGNSQKKGSLEDF